jgi:hypothetical protein
MAAINDALLLSRGARWLDPPRDPTAGWSDSHLDGLRIRAGDFLAGYAKVPARPLFKDPRLCLTLPFWAPLLGPHRRWLILRRPSAVAESLNKPNGLYLSYCR